MRATLTVIFMIGVVFYSFFGSPTPAHAKLLALQERGGLSAAYLFRDKSPNTVEVFLLIKSGGFDHAAPDGLAHYLEHLVFFNAFGIDDRGQASHHDNAQVTGDLTIYSIKGDPANLESYLQSMAKIFEPPSLDQDFMLEELDIIRREYDQRVLELPLYSIVRDLQTHLFGETGRGHSVIGTPESIDAMTPDAAVALHAETHVPANAAMFVIGNTDLTTLAPLVEKHFGGLAAGEPPESREPAPFQERREIVEASVGDANFRQLIYFKRVRLAEPISRDRLQLRLNLLHEIWGSALDGSLAKPLRYDDFITSRFSLDLAAIEPGEILMTFVAAPDEGIEPDDILTSFESTLSEIADKGIPKATFQRIKKKKLSALKETAGKRGRALNLVIDYIAQDAPPISPKTHIRRYGLTTLDDVNDLARALARPGDVAAALVSP